MAFMIIPRLKVNLETYFFQREQNFSKISIYNLGIFLIDTLKVIHKAGYIYNDIKLDNIMTGFTDELPD